MPRSELKRLYSVAHARAVAPQELLKSSKQDKADWRKDKASKAMDALEASTWAYRCATIIGLMAGTVPVRAYQRHPAPDGKNVQWVPAPEEHPLQILVDTPNERDAWPDLVMRSVYYRLFTAELFLTKVRTTVYGPSAWPAVGSRGVPQEIWPYGPDHYAPVPGGEGERFIKEFENRETKKKVAVEDIVHLLCPSMKSEYHGFSAYQAAKNAIEIDLKAQDHQYHSLDNQAVPSGILHFKGAEDLDDDQWDELLDEWIEEYYGAKNARRPMRMGNDVEWIALARTMLELDFINSRKLTREEICITMGVNPIVIGLMDRATYSNYAVGIESVWDLEIIPFLTWFLGGLNRSLSPEFGDDVWLMPEFKGVDALFEKYQRRMKLALECHKDGGIPWPVLNEVLNLGLPEWQGQAARQFELALKLHKDGGIPWSVLDTRFELGLAPGWPGWDRSWRPASMVPSELHLVESLDRE